VRLHHDGHLHFTDGRVLVLQQHLHRATEQRDDDGDGL
jgi:hypothetical protein